MKKIIYAVVIISALLLGIYAAGKVKAASAICPDINKDGKINVLDLILVRNSQGKSASEIEGCTYCQTPFYTHTEPNWWKMMQKQFGMTYTNVSDKMRIVQASITCVNSFATGYVGPVNSSGYIIDPIIVGEVGASRSYSSSVDNPVVSRGTITIFTPKDWGWRINEREIGKCSIISWQEISFGK